MIQKEVEKAFQKALATIGYPDEPILLDIPIRNLFGDYTTTVALRLAKKAKKNPFDLAETIVAGLPKLDSIEKAIVVKPAFINIFLKDASIFQEIQQLHTSNTLLQHSPVLEHKKIMVEYTDPNPFKEFHIGHLYTNTVGEALARMIEMSGAQVKRANYQGDVGLHVAKSIWGMKQLLAKEKRLISDITHLSLTERIQWLGKAYAFGSSTYDTDEMVKKEIQEMNFLIYVAAQQTSVKEKNHTPQVNYAKYIVLDKVKLSEVEQLYVAGRSWSLEYFETIYKRLGTQFDFYYFESVIGEYGTQLVREYVGKNVFIESKGAIIFPGEQYGLHTRVFINSLGLPTYEAKELGLAPQKYKDFPYDQSLIVTGNEINEYFKVLLCALKQIRPELAEKTRHIGHGMVTLSSGKMSSRTGQVITTNSFIESTKEVARNIISKSKKIDNSMIDTVSEDVAIGAIKYALLKSNIGKDIIYNEKESLNFEGDTGPYLQYTYARAASVLRKVNTKESIVFPPTLQQEEKELLHFILQYGGVFTSAAETLQPHLICNYLYRLASTFNAFYHQCPIVTGPEEVRSFRIFLTTYASQIIKHGLTALAIPVLEKM